MPRTGVPRPDVQRPGLSWPPALRGRWLKRRRDKDEPGGEPCPVEPNRPLDLSGGAAAALEFDD